MLYFIAQLLLPIYTNMKGYYHFLREDKRMPWCNYKALNVVGTTSGTAILKALGELALSLISLEVKILRI